MSNSMDSIVSREEMNSLIKGDFTRKTEVAPAASMPKQTMSSTPSRSSRSVVTSLELQFLMSGPGSIFEKNA